MCFEDPINVKINPKKALADCTLIDCNQTTVGSPLHLIADIGDENVMKNRISKLRWRAPDGKATLTLVDADNREILFTPTEAGINRILLSVTGLPADGEASGPAMEMDVPGTVNSEDPPRQAISGEIKTITTMTRTETSFTEDTAFWTAIRNSTDALSFNKYLSFMDWIFCGGKLPAPGFEANRFPLKDSEYRKLISRRFLSFTDSDTYRVVKAATEAFVMVNCGVLQDELQPFDTDSDNAYLDRRDLPIPQNGLRNAFNNDYLVGVDGNGDVLPYLAIIRRKLPDIPIKSGTFEDAVPGRELDNCFGLLQEKLANPCFLELIWSYWHEEGMLVQTMNALSRRFQNIRSSMQDPLANLEMDPLRPLNNLLWSYIQDEQHRLTISRRNYEYDHHYGLRLEGKAVQDFRPVDTRSKFLEAFHHLLRLCTVFYKQDDDTTVKADAFPVLNALKEVHLILSQGAHNQFGDLPSTARIEMLMQQWLLARPEFRELLPTRIMVAYPEPWMDRVDAMKKLQGWTDTSVLHFRNLGMFGEQLLLSIRWGHWSDEFEPVKALNWARFFRPQVQGYIHAYRAATGVDLSADPTVNARVDSTLPSVLLQKRLASQQRAS
ncbi:hypothetical protein [Nitrosomonas nitrosa]|uniref:hypothetical protein n=1 Tax=Nitrosomonas nitrosa TaxID=52442 RepID=UPI0011B1CEF8|nr:hypothetical protein [Nitrosomonas nitrosa]